MKPQKYSSIIVIIVVLFLVLVVLNQWITQKMQFEDPHVGVEIDKKVAPVNQTIIKKENVRKTYRQVTRRTILDPSRKYSLNFIHGDGQQIASFKSANGKINNLEGAIPDGKVDFTDATQETYGSEHYYENKLHGIFEEHYKSGHLKREAKYAKGNVKWSKEYYIDGILRMEQDFQDALLFSESKDVGVGKVNYRDGKVMYEWNIANKSQGGYTRSYDRSGRMVEERIFDKNGRIIKKSTAVEYVKEEQLPLSQ